MSANVHEKENIIQYENFILEFTSETILLANFQFDSFEQGHFILSLKLTGVMPQKGLKIFCGSLPSYRDHNIFFKRKKNSPEDINFSRNQNFFFRVRKT